MNKNPTYMTDLVMANEHCSKEELMEIIKSAFDYYANIIGETLCPMAISECPIIIVVLETMAKVLKSEDPMIDDVVREFHRAIEEYEEIEVSLVME